LLLLDLMSFEELEETIELLRQKLFVTAFKYGYTHYKTISISQSLDLYLLRHEKYKQ
jgi:hypothetical protein